MQWFDYCRIGGTDMCVATSTGISPKVTLFTHLITLPYIISGPSTAVGVMKCVSRDQSFLPME